MKRPVGEEFFQKTKYIRDKDVTPTRIISKPEFFKEYENVPVFYLPPPESRDGKGLWELLDKRRSRRSYLRDKYLSRADLSKLIWSCTGVTKRVEGGFILRTYPSAGALYPLEVYLMINRVEGFSKGIYHFNVRNERLELIFAGDYRVSMARACIDQSMVYDCNVLFIWSAVFDRCRIKYGERAFRYLLIEAGHSCQNLYLACEAMGLGCCAIGAFFDDEINYVLGLDGERESVVYLASVGIIP